MSGALTVYRQRGLELAREVAPHLTVGEVVCRCPEACGNHALDWRLLQGWVALRERAGVPLTVTSGYRCGCHPLELAKAPGTGYGAHRTGQALDLVWPRGLDQKLFLALFADGGLGVYRWGVHLDVGPRRRWHGSSVSGVGGGKEQGK